MENENNNITQKSALGSHTTQIGVQNNYNGITPEKASEIAIDLFMKNFPKLQAKAEETAKARADEFCSTAIKKLTDEHIQDFSPFSDVDVQYVLYKAQRDYARIGTDDLLEQLSSLICSRIKYDKDFIIKSAIDKAIKVAPFLQPKHYDMLVIYFVTKHVLLPSIKTIDDLEHRLCYFAEIFCHFSKRDFDYLNIHGCLQMNMGYATNRFAKNYEFSENDIKAICPPIFHEIHADYGLSYVGIILAITYLKTRINENLDPHAWIY